MSAAYRTSVSFGNTTSSTNPSGAITPAANDLFIVFCNAVGNSNLTPTCADGNSGGSYSLLFAVPSNGGANTLSCFVRNSLVPNTTSTTVTVAIGAHTSCEIAVYALSGCPTAGTSAIVQTATQSNQAAATTPAPTFANLPSTQNLILSVVGNASNPGGITVTAGNSPSWTLDQNAGQTGCGLCTEHTNSQLQTKAVSWGSNSASVFASGAIEIAAEPTTIGVNASKLVAYGLTAPPVGVSVSKLNAYLLPTAPVGVSCSKLVAYAVLTATNTNPPVWPSLTFPNGYVGNPYSYSWDLSPAASPTTYTLNSGSLPPGLTLNSVSGDIGNTAGTPATVGVYTFTLLATNAYGTAISPSYSITISAPSNGPIPVGQVLGCGVVGRAYSETVSADGGTSPYTFAVTGGSLPTGTSLNASTGVISGTPATPGIYNFTIQVTDANGLAGSFSFQITVSIPTGMNYGVFY
jgi:hypothetical protein